jgi:hypothetical protein
VASHRRSCKVSRPAVRDSSTRAQSPQTLPRPLPRASDP